MRWPVLSKRFVYGTFCAIQIVTLVLDLAIAIHASWQRDWSTVQWRLLTAAGAACFWYVLVLLREWELVRAAIDEETLRTHKAQALVAEAMLRHMANAERLDIMVSTDDDATARKH